MIEVGIITLIILFIITKFEAMIAVTYFLFMTMHYIFAAVCFVAILYIMTDQATSHPLMVLSFIVFTAVVGYKIAKAEKRLKERDNEM